jgi:hypothetical protein
MLPKLKLFRMQFCIFWYIAKLCLEDNWFLNMGPAGSRTFCPLLRQRSLVRITKEPSFKNIFYNIPKDAELNSEQLLFWQDLLKMLILVRKSPFTKLKIDIFTTISNFSI